MNTIRSLKAFVLAPKIPLWKYCVMIAPVATIPSLCFAFVTQAALKLIDPNFPPFVGPHWDRSLLGVSGPIVTGPIIETIFLSVGLAILSAFSNRLLFIATVSAILWGCLHGAFNILWLPGPMWGFFIFSCAYLTWRKISYWHAFVAAALPHALNNATVVLLTAILPDA